MKLTSYNQRTLTKREVKIRTIVEKDTDKAYRVIEEDNKFTYGAHWQKSQRKVWLVARKLLQGKENEVMTFVEEFYNTKSNYFSWSHRSIAKESGISESTVLRALNKMQEADFMRLVDDGLWMINPYAFCEGDDAWQAQMYAMYCKLDRRRMEPKEKDTG